MQHAIVQLHHDFTSTPNVFRHGVVGLTCNLSPDPSIKIVKSDTHTTAWAWVPGYRTVSLLQMVIVSPTPRTCYSTEQPRNSGHAQLCVEHWPGRGALGRHSCVWSTGQAQLSVEHWAGRAECGALGRQS